MKEICKVALMEPRVTRRSYRGRETCTHAHTRGKKWAIVSSMITKNVTRKNNANHLRDYIELFYDKMSSKNGGCPKDKFELLKI